MPRSRQALLGWIVLLMTATGMTQATEGQVGEANRMQTFAISGSTGEPDIMLKGFPWGSLQSDSNGNYRAEIPYGWSGTITPVKEGIDFTPKYKTYSKVAQNYENQSYKATVINFEVSGSILVDGTPLTGVVMQGLPGNPTTKSNGGYSVKLPYHWCGAVTPFKEGYIFEPPMMSYENIQEPMSGQNYLGSVIQYSVSGAVGIEGVTLKGFPGNVVTGFNGQYTTKVPHGWGQEVIPTLEGYAFDPPKRAYTKITQNQAGQDYTAKEIYVTISGNTGQPGVILEGLQNSDMQPLISDAKGGYSVKVPFGWSGTVTPRKEGYVFKPEVKSYNRMTRDLLVENYTSSRMRYVISGMTGLPDVVIKGFPTRVVTDQNGSYTTRVDYDWQGEVAPEKRGFEFDPPSRSYNGVQESLTEENYSARMKMCNISGSVVFNGRPMPGFRMTGDSGIFADFTHADGRYTVKVPYGWSGRLTPTKEGIAFDPPSRSYENVIEDIDKDGAFVGMIGGRRSSQVYTIQSTGMNVPSPRIRIVPTSQAKIEVFTAIADDIQVMLHILRKNLAKKPAAMAGVFPDYGDLLGRDQDRLEGLYVQGYGAFLFSEATLARSAPLEKKADKGQAGSTPADPVWDQARQEMGSSSDPYTQMNPRPGAAGITSDQGWETEDLVKELIQTFKHASNIRHLDPNEMITLSVIGRIHVPLFGDLGLTGDLQMRIDPREQPNTPLGLRETTFTLQARKTDIDRFARGQLTQDQFRQKVKVLTY